MCRGCGLQLIVKIVLLMTKSTPVLKEQIGLRSPPAAGGPEARWTVPGQGAEIGRDCMAPGLETWPPHPQSSAEHMPLLTGPQNVGTKSLSQERGRPAEGTKQTGRGSLEDHPKRQ